MLRAVAREGLPPPAAPALAQPHPAELRHEVELGRPRVAERHRDAVEASVDDPKVVGNEALVRDVVFVDPPPRLARIEDVKRLTGGRRWSAGTPTSMTKQPPGSRCAATLRKHATCASCVVRFEIVLKTRYATENVSSTVAVAKSP